MKPTLPLLFSALLLTTPLACTHTPHLDLANNPTDSDLQPYVGRKITVTGVLWEGKFGFIVASPKDPHTPPWIYIQLFVLHGPEEKEYMLLLEPANRHALIQATGTLHFRDAPPPPPYVPGGPPTTAPVTRHYYLDIADTTIKILN